MMFNTTVEAQNIVYVEEPCELVDSAFDKDEALKEYKINIGRAHSGSSDELDIGANYSQPSNGNSHQRCKDYLVRASISGTVRHKYDSACGGHTFIEIEGEDGISVWNLHVDINAENTAEDSAIVKVGDVIGTISDKGCVTFKHIHFVVKKNGVNQTYSNYKFGCRPPESGLWKVNGNCNISLGEDYTIPADLTIKNGATLTLSENTSLDMNTDLQKLLVIGGSKLIIEAGSKLY